ncbi:MAG: hypothetical protein IPM91_04690 [Bacteroidetes bacterium]|nr:hypothetical protein [Bacteroidota bacterium]
MKALPLDGTTINDKLFDTSEDRREDHRPIGFEKITALKVIVYNHH